LFENYQPFLNCSYLKEELINCSPFELSGDEKRLILHLHDLLSQMLILDPFNRITVEDALRHPFFNNSSS